MMAVMPGIPSIRGLQVIDVHQLINVMDKELAQFTDGAREPQDQQKIPTTDTTKL